jgi:CII-binding regulator of phage lambda lysogenization HflD
MLWGCGVTEEGRREPAGQARDLFGGAIEAQRRSVGLAQDWAEGVIGAYRTQAESYQALTNALLSSLDALESTLKSQEETNRALKESLDAYRGVLENASLSQEQNLRVAQSFFEDVLETLRLQLEGSRSLLAQPIQRQQEFFQNMTQEWMDAYAKLLQAPFGLAGGVSRGTPKAGDPGAPRGG